MEALVHQDKMEALDHLVKTEALDHLGIIKALDHQEIMEALDSQGKMGDLDHLGKAEALDPQGIMADLDHQGKLEDLDHLVKMEALEHQVIKEDQVVALDSVKEELEGLTRESLVELMVATMGQDLVDQDLITMEDLTLMEGFKEEMVQIEDLGHLEDQTNMALKEKVGTKEGKVMVDISMGLLSLDRDVPSLHFVIYG